MSEIEIPEEAKNRGDQIIGLTIAIIAILLAIVSNLSNDEDNEKIVKEVQASNGFAWYQSKRIRAGMNELAVEQMKIEAAGAVSDAQRVAMQKLEAKLLAKNAEYSAENDQILKDAEQQKKEAEHASRVGDRYGKAEIFLQIAVVMCSITLLTKKRGFFFAGLALCLVGIGIGVSAFLM